MTSLEVLLLVHAAATWFMAGLIWFVHVVHYPLFADVGRAAFTSYARRHVVRTTWVVAPAMCVEALSAALLVVVAPSGASVVGVALLAVVWGGTWLLAVPRHRELEDGFDATAHRRLVGSNIWRTLAWTARGVVATWMLVGR